MGRPRDRAVSDTLAFVLTFGVIITSVGLVTVVGFAQLEDFEEDEQLQSAEVTFELFATSFDEIEESRAEERTEAIDLSGGSLLVDEPSSSVDLTVSSTAGSTSETFQLNALEYRLSGTEIVYENGATFRGDENWETGLVKHKPNFVCTESAAVVSFVTVDTPSPGQQSGETTLRVTASQVNTTLLYPAEADGRNASAATGLDFELDTERATQWKQYFDRTANWSASMTSDTSVSVTCAPGIGGPERVFVRRTVMNVSFAG